MAQIRMTCIPDETQARVIVGQSGGSTKLRLKSPTTSQTTDYYIEYRDSRFTSNFGDLVRLIKRFEVI